MTFAAGYSYMHPFERVSRLAMIERCRVHLEPSGSIVTRGAVLTQSSIVSVFVTISAPLEFEAGKLHVVQVFPYRAIGLKEMAFHAVDRLVFSCQRKLSSIVIEADDRFPRNLVVTLETVVSFLSPVFVDMTARALGV
jgi:hypothetical protein